MQRVLSDRSPQLMKNGRDVHVIIQIEIGTKCAR